MKKFIGFLLICCIILTLFPDTGYASEALILPSGLNSDDLEHTIDAYVKDHEATTAAMSVAVYSGEELLFQKAYGYTDVENKLMNENDSVFEWGSCTKLLVWTSIMQLAERGQLKLEEDIRQYLPEGFLTKLRYEEPITLLHLMNHTAGWQETVTDLFLKKPTDVRELGDALRLIEPEQIFAPGTITSYSNWGTALAGYIVEQVSGKSFDDYVREFIFQPLGMEHTAIRSDLSDNPWVAAQRQKVKCYTPDRKSLGTCFYYLSLYPSGMATGTIEDFVRFAQAFQPWEEGKASLFENPATLNTMLSPSGYYADEATARNCHGFWVDYLNVPVLWHNGSTVGSSSWFAFHPESRLGVVILTNQSHESIYTSGILSIVFGQLSSAPTASSRDISGLYQSSRTAFTGFGKLYHLFGLSRIEASDNGYLSPDTGFTYTGISNNSYLMDMGGLKQFLLFSRETDNGKRILQFPGDDRVEANGLSILAELLLLILFMLSFIHSLLSLVFRLVRHLRHKKAPLHSRLLTGVNSSVLLSMLLSGYLGISLFSPGAAVGSIRWSLALNAFLALIPIAYALYLIISFRKLECPARTKAGLAAAAAMGLIMSLNTIYWNTYQFWQ